MNRNEPEQPAPEFPPSPGATPTAQDEDPRVVAALEEYMAAIEAGQKPNRVAFLARNSDIAEALEECVEAMEALHVASSSAGSSLAGQAAAFPALGWQPGTCVEDFRIIREVGRGGMGVVFEAEQISLGRRIALKVLPFAFTLDARQLQRFKNEARAAAQLHHSNIVPIYSVGNERGVHFYAMQYIDGKSLAEVILELQQIGSQKHTSLTTVSTRSGIRQNSDLNKQGTRSGIRQNSDSNQRNSGEFRYGSGATGQRTAPSGHGPAEADTGFSLAGSLATEYSLNSPGYFRAVAKLGVQAAEALEHAHSYGVVHRDIKPANLLMDVSNHLWVTDFGLAQFQGDAALTRTGDLLGTLRYMSPEQALAKRGLVDHRTDIYSLGATLYELLTLQPAYDGRDREELLRQIAFEEPRPPSRVNPHVPVDLETIVLKAMAKGVEERYATAQDLAEDLRRFLENKPIRARRPTLLERAAKWARRHKGLVATGALVLLLAAVGFGVSTALLAREEGRTRAAKDRLAEEQKQTQQALKRERQRAREAREAHARAEKSFQQARKVVDFLIQVSEGELAGNPMMADPRRRVLEAALVYYQGFIDDRQDDSASQPDLTAAKERVAGILGELYASEGFWRTMFLTRLLDEEAVRKDLNLEEAQAKRAREQTDGLFKDFGPKIFGTFRNLTPEARRKKLQEMTRAAERSLADSLTPQRVHRLKQIALQQRGAQALTDTEVAKSLELTTAQKEKIRTIQAEARKAAFGRPPGGRWGPNPQEMKALHAKLLGVLTEKQRAIWVKIMGKPLQGKIGHGFKGPWGPGPKPGRPHPEFKRPFTPGEGQGPDAPFKGRFKRGPKSQRPEKR